jgi:hypothetical protein
MVTSILGIMVSAIIFIVTAALYVKSIRSEY